VAEEKKEEKKEKKQGLVQEFMDFLLKYQVIGLAVAVIIGAAATKMVTATVNDIIMPIIGALIPGGSWRTAVVEVGSVKFLVGDFVGAVIDFLIIALVVFLVVKFMIKGDTSKKI
jgi:large conductance mechanosensitive channel